MWLTCSSIGRKFVMAVTGVCLVLFVTFHVLMNSVAIIWPTAYNVICQFLGANWYALVATVGLAALFIIHIIYALWLTLQNRRARGNDRYAIDGHAPGVEWSSKNMLVLGIVVLAFLVVHMIQFWAKMQLQELLHHDLTAYPEVNGSGASPEFGTLFLQAAFSHWYTPLIYIIGFIALWFHMNHGFWSMFQTIGWNNQTWLNRLKCISCWWTSIVVVLFVAQAIVFTCYASTEKFLKDPALQEQYSAFWAEKSQALLEEFNVDVQVAQQKGMDEGLAPMQIEAMFLAENGDKYIATAQAIIKNAKAQAPDVPNMNTETLTQFVSYLIPKTAQAKQTLLQSEPNQE